MRSIFLYLWLFLLMPLMRACSPLANMTPPEVRLVNLRPGQITVFQSQGQIILSILNPNPDPITVNGATYELIIDDAHVGRAISSEKLEIPGYGAAEQHATLYISNLTMLNRMRQILEQPKITYAIRASINLTTAHGSGTISAQSAGELNAKPKSP